jgi:hypothetical protein
MTGVTSSSIDIYRNSVFIVTVPNNGFYTDAPVAAAVLPIAIRSAKPAQITALIKLL